MLRNGEKEIEFKDISVQIVAILFLPNEEFLQRNSKVIIHQENKRNNKLQIHSEKVANGLIANLKKK